MDLLVIPVPFFNKDMAVDSYYFRHQLGNDLFQANQSTRDYDGATLSPLMAMLNLIGIEAITMGKPIFVPIKRLMLLGNLPEQCKQPANRVVLVMESDVRSEEPYISRIVALREMGFRFAMQKIDRLDTYAPILNLCDFIFFNHKLMNLPNQQVMLRIVSQELRHLSVVMTHIDTQDMFEPLRTAGPRLFEGRFYRTPLTRGNNKVSPLKMNLINLLNLVRNEFFEFSSVATIVQRDTALSVSLMKMVNSPFIGLSQKVTSINHAVTILGEIEVRKWVTTAVSRLLGSDRPDELSRLSLIRAKFCENLAALFNIAPHAQSLFLMGLFSVLDVILDVPMAEALDMVKVSDSIRNALVSGDGEFGAVLKFLFSYEAADWKTVSRTLIVHDLKPDDVYDAYTNAMMWYRDLIADNSATTE